MQPIFAKEGGRWSVLDSRDELKNKHYVAFFVKFDGSEKLQYLVIKTTTDKNSLAISYSIDNSDDVICDQYSWANALLQAANTDGFYHKEHPKEFKLQIKGDRYSYSLTEESKKVISNLGMLISDEVILPAKDCNGNSEPHALASGSFQRGSELRGDGDRVHNRVPNSLETPHQSANAPTEKVSITRAELETVVNKYKTTNWFYTYFLCCFGFSNKRNGTIIALFKLIEDENNKDKACFTKNDIECEVLNLFYNDDRHLQHRCRLFHGISGEKANGTSTDKVLVDIRKAFQLSQ